MNERIKELLDKSATFDTVAYYINPEKFAELIVRECMNQCFTEDGERIRRHFGIE